MEDRVPKGRMRRIAALVACAAGFSCGTGIRDNSYEGAVTQKIGPEGGQIALMEGTLDILPDCLGVSTPITLRRYPSIKHTGAIGPVFEIQVPEPGTFTHDPVIEILLPSEVATDPKKAYEMGLLVPGVDQWFPITTLLSSDFTCPSANACGDLQINEFTSPDGGQDKNITETTVLQFAIVQSCLETKECLKGLACNSHACQECPTGSICSTGSP